jgi:hypothetical protein
MLKVIDHFPDGFLDIDARHLHSLLPQPTLMHLAGRQQPALFVAILLHGNEDTGLKAIQQVLKNMPKGNCRAPYPFLSATSPRLAKACADWTAKLISTASGPAPNTMRRNNRPWPMR